MADLGMRFDHLEFDLRQAGRLAQNFGGDGHLPDIVNGPGQAQPFHPFRGESHFLADGPGQIRHPFLMPGGIGVSFFGYRG